MKKSVYILDRTDEWEQECSNRTSPAILIQSMLLIKKRTKTRQTNEICFWFGKEAPMKNQNIVFL